MAARRRGSRGAPKLLRRLALAATFPAALALVEVVLRASGSLVPDPPLQPGDREVDSPASAQVVVDAAVGWRFAPYAEFDERTDEYAVHYRANALGFRRNAPYDEIDAARSVVFLGAANALGAGVDERETLVAHVSRALGAARVVDLAMAGFGVDQTWCTLRAYGLAERPTLVIALFTDDDLTRSTTSYAFRGGWLAKPTFALAQGRLVERTDADSPGAFARWISQRLRLAEAWRRLDRHLGRTRGWGDRWALNRALFAALRDDCLANGARLLAVHLPRREDWRETPAYTAEFRRLGIDFLDLGTVAVEDPRALYFAHEPHLDRDGHALAGREIARFLAEQGFAEARLR